ncbi:AraC family transcriptional regulator [Leucobacter sp. BZR 635]
MTETMEIPRIPRGFLLTTLEHDVSTSTDWHEHSHEADELLWSEGGIVTLEAGGRVWAIPPALGVWIPARTPHRAATVGAAQVRATYLTHDPIASSAMPAIVTGVALSDALRALLLHNHRAQLDSAARLRLQHVILDLLAPAPQTSFGLSMPTSGHLRAIAEAVLTHPADKRTTADWAQLHGMHQRTLARQFEAETGITFTQWRIQARLQLAIRELANGAAVVSISRRLGYRNPSTFIEHFRTLTGQTPTEYVRGDAGSAAA